MEDNNNNIEYLGKLVLVEGFDMVGKSTLIKELYPNHSKYHATHDLTDETVGRDNSWTIGYGVVDMLSQMYSNGIPNLVIDRGVISSYVYTKLSGKEFDSKIMEYYKNNKFFKENIRHILVVHQDKVSAKLIYDRSQSRTLNPNKISAELDKFDTFGEYWKQYEKAMNLFIEAYSILGISPEIRISSFRPNYIKIGYHEFLESRLAPVK